MSTPSLTPERRGFFQRHWKKIVGAVVGLVVVVLGASFIYAKFINDAPDELDEDDLLAAVATTVASTADPATAPVITTVATGDTADTSADEPATTVAVAATTVAPADAATTVAPADPPTTVAPPAETPTTVAPPAESGVDGVWDVTTESTLRYRVTESINGFDTEAVGGTNQISGTLALAGTTATAATFTVDMTTFSSDESRRDGQFNGRIMSVDEFPTSTFVLTAPIEFGSIPAPGETITASATGDLTLRGVTNSVTFDVTATLDNGRIAVLGNIPVEFANHGIPNPSFGTISTEDNGLLEFILVFTRA